MRKHSGGGKNMWTCPCLMMAAMSAVIVGLFPLGTDAAGPTVVAIDYRWSAQKCTTFRENFDNVSEKFTTFRENFTTFPKNLQRFAKILQHFRKISGIATWLYSKKNCVHVFTKVLSFNVRKMSWNAPLFPRKYMFTKSLQIILSKFCITSRNLMRLKA